MEIPERIVLMLSERLFGVIVCTGQVPEGIPERISKKKKLLELTEG